MWRTVGPISATASPSTPHGRGLATAGVREVCALAAAEYGLTGLRASTTLDNAASRAVLARTGFTPCGEIELDGRPGLRFERSLDDEAGRQRA